MSHEIELKNCNVVVIANIFNLSIINTVWLFKNNIFSEDDLKGSTSLPVFVEVKSKKFHFTLVPERLQYSIDPKMENPKESIDSKIGTFIRTLPHTPYTACGLNFIYHVKPEKGDLYALSRSLFCNERSRLFEDLDTDDVRFGGYFSRDLIETKFRLDAKPVKINQPQEKDKEVLQFSYNFNISLSPDDDYHSIISLFEKWDQAQRITLDLTNKINLVGSND